MTVPDLIIELLKDVSATVYFGTAQGDSRARDGLVTFFPLPSGAISPLTNTSIDLYQIDIWHQDIDSAHAIKEEVIKALVTGTGVYENIAYITGAEDNGMISEDGDNLWHGIVTARIKWGRRY